MTKPLIIMDVDATLLDKSEIGNGAFIQQSLTGFFFHPIGLKTHPVTGEPDTHFRRYSIRDAWKYKIEQVLEDQGTLDYIPQDGDSRIIRSVDEVDLDLLVDATMEDVMDRLNDPHVLSKGTIQVYTTADDLKLLEPYVLAIGLASLDNAVVQKKVIELLGYKNVVDPTLMGFAEDGKDKHDILDHVLNAYFAQERPEPTSVWIVGDTTHDVEAAKGLNHNITTRAVGVLTGGYGEQELRDAGADYIIPKLNNEGVITLINHLEESA